jgi:acyl-coenzyme A synthetase/AMP-(fatty) acid ligase
MLYLRWLETVRIHAHRPALSGDGWSLTFSELATAVERSAPATATVVARTGDTAFFIDLLRAWRDGQTAIPTERDAPAPKLKCPPPPGTSLVKYTPGASGIPRGIFFNDAALEADGDRITAAMGLSADSPNLAVISLAHSYGFSNIVLPLVLHGVPACLMDVPFPRVVEAVFATRRNLTIAAVPSMWRAWHRAGILINAPIRFAVSAGAPLSIELEREVHTSSGIKIHNFYGASECGGIALDLTDKPRQDAGIVGAPLPGVAVYVTTAGRIRVKSNAVAIRYDESRGEEELGGGSHLTRDIGHVDESGIVRLTGVLGGAINVSGRKVSPAKVEAGLLATGLCVRAKVIGISSADAERHEEIAALVELSAGAGIEDLRRAALDHLQAWELPRHWRGDSALWTWGDSALRGAFQ